MPTTISEEDAVKAATLASQFRNNPKTISENRDAFIKTRDILTAYEEQQTSAGRPLFEQSRRQRIEEEQTFRRKFQDRENYGMDPEQKQEFDNRFQFDPSSKKAVFVSEFFEREMGLESRDATKRLDTLIPAYSEDIFGERVEDVETFYKMVGDDYNRSDEIDNLAQDAAMKWDSPLEGFANLSPEVKTAEMFQSKAGWEHFETTHRNTSARFSPYRGMIKWTSEQLGAITGANDEKVAATYRQIAEMLVDVPSQDLNLVLAAISANAPEGNDKSYAKKLFERLGRGSQNLVFGTINRPSLNMLQQGEATVMGITQKPVDDTLLEYVSEQMMLASDTSGAAIQAGAIASMVTKREMEPVTDEMRSEVLNELDRASRAIELHDRLRTIANNDIDPAKGEGLVTNGLLNAAESIPYTVTSLAGAAGFIITSNALAQDSYQRLSEADSTLTRQQKLLVTNLAAPIQAGLERISGRLMTGNLKSLNRFYNQATITNGAAARRFATRLLGTSIVEQGQENLQDVTPFVVQGVISALSEDMPGVDWEARYGEVANWDYQAELFFSVLPLSLIGAGAGTITDFRDGRSLISNRLLLETTLNGNKDAAAEIKELADAGDLAGAQSKLREAFRESGADQKNVSQVKGEAQIQLMEQAARMTEVYDNVKEMGLLPVIGKTDDGWTVTPSEGQSVTFATHSEAMDAVQAYTNDKNIKLTEEVWNALRSTSQNFEVGETRQIQMSPFRPTVEEQVEAGEISQEKADERSGQAKREEAKGEEQEQTAEEAAAELDEEYQRTVAEDSLNSPGDVEVNKARMVILGSNEVEFKGKIAKALITLNRDYVPFTVIEEMTETDAKKMIKNGQSTTLVGWLRSYEKLSGEALFDESKSNEDLTASDIVEAWSDMTVSYAQYADTKMGENVIGGNHQAFIQKVLNSPVGSVLSSYMRMFRAILRRADRIGKLRDEGKLDPNFERALQKSLGISEQDVYNGEVVEEAQGLRDDLAQQLGGDTDVSFSVVTRQQDADFEPTEDAPFSIIEKGSDFQATAMPDGRTLAGPASFSILAFHGTPHKVDEFSTDKIGTGEGAQAYGWGLYFAESEKIAKHYRDALGDDFLSLNGQKLSEWREKKEWGEDGADFLFEFLREGITDHDFGDFSQEKAYFEGKRKLDRLKRDFQSYTPKDADFDQEIFEQVSNEIRLKDKALEFIQTISDESFGYKKFNNLYTVELDGNKEDFLDWDKPLSEQSKKVQDALQKEFPFAEDFGRRKTGDMEGQELYRLIASRNKSGSDSQKAEAASADLLQLFGIKGIRYLDGNSRSYGEGSYNYVIFDESLVKILQENGQPIEGDQGRDEISYSVIKRRASLRLRMTRQQIADAVKNSSDWKDFYTTHEELLKEYFGPDAELFQRILSATSQASSVKSNVALALKAYGQLRRGEEFAGYLPAVIGNLERIKEGTEKLSGKKIGNYEDASSGDTSKVVVDRHVARMLFGVVSPTPKQFEKAEKVLTEIAEVIGWEPRQVQAAIWAASIRKSGKEPESYDRYLARLNREGTLRRRIGSPLPRDGGDPITAGGGRSGASGSAGADQGVAYKDRAGEEAGEPLTETEVREGIDEISYSVIKSTEYLRNDDRFDDLLNEGKIKPDQSIDNFAGLNILLHAPDNAFSGKVIFEDGQELEGKGGVFYPALFADQNYFWASTKAVAERTANHLNEIGRKNGGRILMGLVSAPVGKLFSSTTMSRGVVRFFEALADQPRKTGVTKSKLNSMIVKASKVSFTDPNGQVKKFKENPLVVKDGLAANIERIDGLLDPENAVFAVRKAFVQSLIKQLTDEIGTAKAKADPKVMKQAQFVADKLHGDHNPYAAATLAKGELSVANLTQGLGNLLTEPFLRDFQEGNQNGMIYAVIEVQGEVEAIESDHHESYPFAILPKNRESKVVLHTMKEAFDWQEVVGHETSGFGDVELIDPKTKKPYTKSFKKARNNLFPTSGMSSTTLKVMAKPETREAGKELSFSVISDPAGTIEGMFSPFNATPELRLKMVEEMKHRGAEQAQKWKRIIEQNRTLKSLNREAQVREGLEYDRLLRETFGADTTEKQDALPPVDRQAARSEAKKVAEDWKKKTKQSISNIDREILIGGLRTLEAITSALPAEVRGKIGGSVKLAQLKKPEAMIDEIERRTKAIDRELERYLKNEANEEIEKLFTKIANSREKGAGKTAKGKNLPEIYVIADKIREVQKGWSTEEGAAESEKIHGLIESNAIADEDLFLQEKLAELIPLFSGWNGRTKNVEVPGQKKKKRIRIAEAAGSAQRFAAFKSLSELWNQGKEQWKMDKALEKERRDILREVAIGDIKKHNKKSRTRDEQDELDKSRKSLPRNFAYNSMSFDGVLQWFFGEDSQIYKWATDSQRKAENQYTDRIREIGDQLDALFTELGGTGLKGKQLRFKMAQKEHTFQPPVGERRKLSQLEMIQALLMWQQEDGKRHMEGRKDDNGKVVSDWGYDQKFIDEVRATLSEEGFAVYEWLADFYANEYDRINKVYKKIFGVDMPRHINYAPLTVQQDMTLNEAVDPLTNFFSGGMSGVSGSFKTRGNATVEPKFNDGLKTFLAHQMQMEHFIAFAEFSRELKSITGKAEVRAELKRAGGEDAVKTLGNWVEEIDQGGIRKAGGYMAINKTLNRMGGRLAQAILFAKLQTILLNATQLGAAAVVMTPAEYTAQMYKLFRGKLDWFEALNTPYIKRRIEEMPPIIRQALDSQDVVMPSRLTEFSEKTGFGISWSDGLATAGTYVMVLDQQRTIGKKAGKTGKELEDWARNETERIVDRLAQPTRRGSRSIFENILQDGAWKTLFNFGSESRKNLGLIMLASKGDAKTKAGTAFYVLIANALFAEILRTGWRDLLNDEESEDDWDLTVIALNAVLDPLYGVPVFGAMAQDAVKSAAGQRTMSGTVLDTGQNAIPALKRMAELDYNAEEFDNVVTDMNRVLGGAAMLDQRAASIKSIGNILEQAAKLANNLID